MDQTPFELLERRIGFTLSREISDISFRGSFQPGEKEFVEKNNFYVKWGCAIIQCALAVYLYLTERHLLTAEKLDTKVRSCRKYIEEEIYYKYNLNIFVIKTVGANRNSYPDITSKIIVLLYKEHGFIDVCNFLLPYLNKFQTKNHLDYERVIRNFAENRNLKVDYEITQKGVEKNVPYRCELSVGKIKIAAKGSTKDEAKLKAEKLFISNHKNKFQKKDYQLPLPKQQKRDISEIRKSNIIDIVRLLRLNGNFITFEQLDEVLTHPSICKKLQIDSKPDNAVLSALGFLVLKMLEYEYMYENDMIVSFNREAFVKSDNLSKGLSDNYLKYLLRSPVVVSLSEQNQMKTEVFQGFLASYWINYVSVLDKKIANCAKKYVFRVFEICHRINNLDYAWFLREAIRKYGWKLSASTSEQQYSENISLYNAVFTVTGLHWWESGFGAYDIEKNAKLYAVKEVLRKLIIHCPEDDEITYFLHQLYDPDQENRSQTENAVNKAEKSDVKKPDLSVIPKPETKAIPKFNDSIHQREKQADIPFNDTKHILYVYKGKRSCEKKNHNIIPATGILSSRNNRPVKINIQYCKTCNEYFIGLESYKNYQKDHGGLLGNIYFENIAKSPGHGYGNLADESPLRLCGYTVKEGELSVEKRRFILKYILDHDILDKPQVVNYLEFFVATNEKQKNKQEAVQKWRDDLDWVNHYQINSQIHVQISKIKKKNKPELFMNPKRASKIT